MLKQMKTANKIMGIISIVMGALCVLPSIIGIIAGSALITTDELAAKIIATILFEAFLFVGGAIATTLCSKPFATILSSALLMIAGILQVVFAAEFNLKFIGVISLLILSWVAVISIAFGCIMFALSIFTIRKSKNEKSKLTKDDVLYIQTDATISPYDELRKYKILLDDGVITQEEFEAKKKQLIGL